MRLRAPSASRMARTSRSTVRADMSSCRAIDWSFSPVASRRATWSWRFDRGGCSPGPSTGRTARRCGARLQHRHHEVHPVGEPRGRLAVGGVEALDDDPLLVQHQPAQEDRTDPAYGWIDGSNGLTSSVAGRVISTVCTPRARRSRPPGWTGPRGRTGSGAACSRWSGGWSARAVQGVEDGVEAAPVLEVVAARLRGRFREGVRTPSARARSSAPRRARACCSSTH